MKISQICLDLIKKWEGFRPDAYLDPVRIPTIGYGTIRYPDGQKVRLGDRISEQEAEVFLKNEVDEVVAGLAEPLKNVTLTQNQFDAVVSLCYNIGIGGFLGSTVLKRLKEGKLLEASVAFGLWNKGTIDGVKQVIPGLTNRRREERDLFEKQGAGGDPIEVEPSPQDGVTRLVGYRDGNDNIVVAHAKDNSVVEILQLKSSFKEDFFTTLRQYKNADSFEIAPAGSVIPPGERTVVEGKAHVITPSKTIPRLDRPLLVFGMSDDDAGVVGADVRELQSRLRDLGYYSAEINGVFDKATDEGARRFQADTFGQSEADGRVGPKTWRQLWGDVAAPQPAPEFKTDFMGAFLLLTKTGQKDVTGCVKLRMDYVKEGSVNDSIFVRSGQANRQFFRKGKDSRQGSFEPIPEGRWKLHDMEWAGGKDVYDRAVWNDGLGPVKIRMDFDPPDGTRRAAIEIHIDWNKTTRGGTAGCVGVDSVADFKRLATWLRDTDPKDLYVDWGLGSVRVP